MVCAISYGDHGLTVNPTGDENRALRESAIHTEETDARRLDSCGLTVLSCMSSIVDENQSSFAACPVSGYAGPGPFPNQSTEASDDASMVNSMPALAQCDDQTFGQ